MVDDGEWMKQSARILEVPWDTLLPYVSVGAKCSAFVDKL